MQWHWQRHCHLRWHWQRHCHLQWHWQRHCHLGSQLQRVPISGFDSAQSVKSRVESPIVPKMARFQLISYRGRQLFGRHRAMSTTLIRIERNNVLTPDQSKHAWLPLQIVFHESSQPVLRSAEQCTPSATRSRLSGIKAHPSQEEQSAHPTVSSAFSFHLALIPPSGLDS